MTISASPLSAGLQRPPHLRIAPGLLAWRQAMCPYRARRAADGIKFF
ncbi:hypothetical protein [Bradyrhizobium sp. HKCCYLS2033]